jgi:hypothetical protein
MTWKHFFITVAAIIVAQLLWKLFTMKIAARANSTEEWERF